MKRRTVALAGVGALAAVGGALTALRSRQEPAAPTASVDLWTRAFARPDGSILRLDERKGRPLLVNFWATWCAPCVTELPLLDAFAREQASDGFRVVALAVDERDAVRGFLSQRALGLEVALAGSDGMALARVLGNRQGGLPYSVAFDRSGRAFASRTGAVNADLLRLWAATAAS